MLLLALCAAGLLLYAVVLRAVRETGRKRGPGLAAWVALEDGMRAGVLLVDGRDRYVYASAAAEKVTGVTRSALLGRKVEEVEHPLRMPLLLAIDLLRHCKRRVVTARFPVDDRMLVVEFSRAVSDSGQYAGVAALVRDMTEECEFCGHLMRVERMTLLGELAAAMAHEINSPLGGVMESVRIISKEGARGEKTRRFLPLVQQGLEQIASTVRQMLEFATPHEPEMTRVVLEDVIRQCADFLGYRRKESGAELRLDLKTGRTTVTASAQMISQVFINLINNAFDAVAGRDGAIVEIRSRLLPERGEVTVSVVDSGPGVPSKLRARVFEPFFTTKPSGKGTGLGLSISARIASRHGGRILVADNEGGGAVFSLVLPVTGRSEERPEVSNE
jgi:PAS domain S-box-containing protein